MLNKENLDFILPMFALNKVEDAVQLLNLNDNNNKHYIEKSNQEFTNKHL